MFILVILISLLLFFGVFKLIKKVCCPIRTISAIFLTIITIPTCGIAIVIYKLFHGAIVTSSYGKYNTYSSDANDYDFSKKVDKKKEKKKVARSYTDNFGKTTFYDENGEYIKEGFDNLGKTIYTSSTGDYIGESYNDSHGHTTYTDKDGNVINSSTTNYLGDDNFSDGTTTTSDNFGNKYYH